jgi:hypothetical protein
MMDHGVSLVAPAAGAATADDAPPAPSRQAELRAAYEANVASGRPPYAGVPIRTRGELAWILAEQGWSGEHDAYTFKYVLAPRGESSTAADLRQANLSHAVLGAVLLRRADLTGANLVFADLRGAHLADARLVHADMGRVDLAGAELNYADLTDAHLREAALRGANLQYATLAGARLHKADLRAAILHGARLDVATILSDVTFDAETWLGDVIWDGAALTRIEWSSAPRLGDESAIGRASNHRAQQTARRAAVRAYQQLALELLGQGLAEDAGRYAYRGQVLQRKAFLRQGKIGRWLFSWLLGALAGYGYRMGRILVAYLLVVLTCALAYYLLGATGSAPTLAPHEALLVSVTAFHGRVFAEQFRATSPQAWFAAAEAIAGTVIEGVFIAMLAQRFFGR